MFTVPDALYRLLPAYIRLRDQQTDKTLQQLLGIIGDQAGALQRDLERMYDGWFIETCEEWLVPYIADLLGLPPSDLALGPLDTERERRLRQVLSARSATANAIAQRRRKGTLWILEEIARDVAHWPARAEECYRRLVVSSHLDHLQPARTAIADLRSARRLAELDGPFDDFCHLGDVRRIGHAESRGRFNIPNVALFVWRLRPYSVTTTPAYQRQDIGRHCFTFSALGNDTQLFRNPVLELVRSDIAGARNLPVPILRWALESHEAGKTGLMQADPLLFGEGSSIFIETDDWPTPARSLPITPDQVIPADLSDWSYKVPKGHVAVDPVLGRIAFPTSQPPRKSVRVSYYYGFAMDIGGGSYERPPLPLPPQIERYQVGVNGSLTADGSRMTSIKQAFSEWRGRRDAEATTEETPKPPSALVIELIDNDIYHGRFELLLEPGETVAIVAAKGTRPIIWLPDETTSATDAITIRGGRGSRVILDGLLIAGSAVEVGNRDSGENEGLDAGELCELWIRHSTLVPGGSLHPSCDPRRPSAPSVVVENTVARLRVEASIVGAIRILSDGRSREPTPVNLCDSIVDATSEERMAIGGAVREVGYAELNIVRCTLVGFVQVHALRYAEDSLFTSRVQVVRRQLGCLRFCYIPSESRTPRRHACQPDGVVQVVDTENARRAKPLPQSAVAKLKDAARLRVTPRFESLRYGTQTYLRLTGCTAPEIKRGAHDESEMGVYHDLFEPQRLTMLGDRLAEFVPANCDAAVIFVS
ncbi:hypothetical protein [Azotobacter chroococcum]|uniref:hypothetical protein n=1 Tax=Azotobacter chroococcum TaxID=353 RepID=UPI0010AE9653|nr:hypothetical protein [Azotobacter chroococcum]TKD35893.1 hypothetical protein FCG41_16895 [Azotobacter chroococcum]